MSDFCSGCAYDVKLKTGQNACPFNYLYWNFLDTHGARLAGNVRMALPLRTLAGKGEQEMAEVRASARAFLAGLDEQREGSGPYRESTDAAE